MDAFGIVLIAMVVVGILVAVASYWGSGDIYRGLGRTGGLSLDEPENRPVPVAGSPAAHAEAQEEIRQMLEAKSARSVARGDGPIDVEAEMDALTATPTPIDPALREEIRELVVARNERRVRRGQEPLNVEAEVEREVLRLGS